MTVPPETISAAAAWASGHGCRNIGSCSATPLEAFIAGAAAERDRIRELAASKHAWYSDEEPRCIDSECANCEMRPITGPFADLLDGAP